MQINKMELEEIINRAIPLSFPGVKCAATISIETQKAKMRRDQLKQEITTLLENKVNAGSLDSARVDANNY